MLRKRSFLTLTCVYTAAESATSRSERAYGELKQHLLAGDFALTERLGEERLGSLVGVSRTPIREALSRLYVEGFVERLPEGGYCPAAPNLHVIRERYEVRRGLELLALRRPIEAGTRHDRAQLEALRAEWLEFEAPTEDPDEVPGPDPSFVLLDEEFHLRLAESAGNRELVTMLQGVNERIRLVRVYDFLTPERIELTVEQHLAIVEAVLAGHLDHAEMLLNRHLSESLAVVEERASAALARMLEERDRP
jgi:DNA-binding GntR family transcriptional regulator